MNFILRVFLTFSSVSFFLIIYLVQNDINPYVSTFGSYTWVFYVMTPFVLAWFALLICKLLAVSSINKVNAIETSNNDFLANYLAFFFVALSVKDYTTFWIVFGMTILFTFVSRVSYFNPVFLVFGYNFYYVHTGENVKIMLISKSKLKDPSLIDSISVRRINDYTYIEI